MFSENELLLTGRYRITRSIGQNNAGFIYEGFDNNLNQTVVINQVTLDDRQDLTSQEKMLRAVRHESFLPVVNLFAERDTHFVVMEKPDGEFLSNILDADKNALKFSDVMNWTEQLLDGLSYLNLHLPTVIHGDLRPQNIFVTGSGKVKMLASAILKTREAASSLGNPSNEVLNYSPLEQIWGSLDSGSQKAIATSFDEDAEKNLFQPLDARCDIYSLGVLLYRMLTARFPPNALERSIEILEGNADPLVAPAALNAEIAPEISDIILKTLEIKRQKRFDSAAIMRQFWRTALFAVNERQNRNAVTAEKAETPAPEMAFQANGKSAPNANQSPKITTATAGKFFSDDSFFDLLEPDNETNCGENRISTVPAAASTEELSNVTIETQTNQAGQKTVRDNIGKTGKPADAKIPLAADVTANDKPAQKSANAEAKKIDNKKLVKIDEAKKSEFVSVDTPIITGDTNDNNEKSIASPSPVKPEKVFAPVVSETPAIVVGDAVKVTPAVGETDYRKDVSPIESGTLFETAELKSRSKMMIPAVIIILLLIGGGVFAFFKFGAKPDSGVAPQIVAEPVAEPPSVPATAPMTETTAPSNTTQTISPLETAEPPTGTATPDIAPETSDAAQTKTALPADATTTTRRPPAAAVKAKPEAVKPPPPPATAAKPPAKPKKKVTVDDLITDY